MRLTEVQSKLRGGVRQNPSVIDMNLAPLSKSGMEMGSMKQKLILVKNFLSESENNYCCGFLAFFILFILFFFGQNNDLLREKMPIHEIHLYLGRNIYKTRLLMCSGGRLRQRITDNLLLVSM